MIEKLNNAMQDPRTKVLSISLLCKLNPKSGFLKSLEWLPEATGTTCSLAIVPVQVRGRGGNSPPIMSDWTHLGHIPTPGPETGNIQSNWFKPEFLSQSVAKRMGLPLLVKIIQDPGGAHFPLLGDKEDIFWVLLRRKVGVAATIISFTVCPSGSLHLALQFAHCPKHPYEGVNGGCSSYQAVFLGTELCVPRGRGAAPRLQIWPESPYVHQAKYPQGRGLPEEMHFSNLHKDTWVGTLRFPFKRGIVTSCEECN